MAQSPTKASTQEHLEIEEIFDNLVILKNNGAALVIQTTAVNFGLLSETEQDAIIYAYAGLLNSLSFPIQIVIRSKRMDVSSYLESLIKWEQKQTNEKIRNQIRKYREFISSTIRENNVLDKRFYVVIPMFPEEVSLAASSPLPFANKKNGPHFSKEYIVERAKNVLLPKRDHLVRQLTRLGLKATQLSTQQLIELFYDIYNPSVTGAQRLATRTEEYLSPIVSSASAIRQEKSMNPGATNSDTLAEGMSPASILEEVYGKTPVQQQAALSQISQNQNGQSAEPATTPPLPTPPLPTPAPFAQPQNLPNTQWNQTIQNTQTPWPTTPNPQGTTIPFNQASPPAVAINQKPIIPVTQASQQQSTPQSNQTPDQVIMNLQKAIEDARRKSAQFNGSSNSSNIPTSQAGMKQ